MLTMRRTNGMGQEYVISGDQNVIIVCNGDMIKINQTFDTISQCWYNWQMLGQPIQQAFSCLNAEEREFILTGLTPEKWNDIFKDKEE